jgi:hypothetical protein
MRNAIIALTLCLTAVSVIGDTVAPDSYALSSPIQFQQGYLRVRLHHAPWNQVANEIERQTGIAIQVKGPLAGTVTQTFDALPLEQALRRLFRDAHLVVFYAPAPRDGRMETRVSHVWLIPKASPAVNTPITDAPIFVDTQAENTYEPDDRQAALQAFTVQGDLKGLQQALVDPDQHVQAMAFDLLRGWGTQGVIEGLLRATASNEPSTRVRALTLLRETGLEQEGLVLSAYAQALTDPDVTVKTYALHALAERGGADALNALRQALQDPDTSIRMMVIENVARTREGRSLLQEALSNDDPDIRGLAAFWLEETAEKEP